MTLRINSVAPDFTAETTQGTIDFHEWIGDGWAVLFSHPKDFTPVCTTELGYMAGLNDEFARRNCKIIAVSVDTVEDHKAWLGDIETVGGHAVGYPLIGDPVYRKRGQITRGLASAVAAATGALPRQALHAHKLGLLHPDSGEFCEWQCDLPADMQSLLDIQRPQLSPIPG